MAQSDYYRGASGQPNDRWTPTSRSSLYGDAYQNGVSEVGNSHYWQQSVTYTPTQHIAAFVSPMTAGYMGRNDAGRVASPTYASRPTSAPFGTSDSNMVTYGTHNGSASQNWDQPGRFSPSDSMDDIVGSPSKSDYTDPYVETSVPGKAKESTKGGGPPRRTSNRDEFDGPHQFLRRPSPDYVARQERELPHLPTNLQAHEQDSVLTEVNDRLSRCAFDFVAKYQFPIPLTEDMRRVERPQDREWNEWVHLLKRLATKRRIPARFLYNGQIKQFVTILENSLEMRHAAKHQSRPLKDDRNILQLISAGIQVAKILKDAQAMAALDDLYVLTERQIQERATARRR